MTIGSERASSGHVKGARMRHVRTESLSVAGTLGPRVLILGATSSIAQEVARLYAAERGSLLLVGRREDMLRSIARELTAGGAAEVGIATVDFVAEERPADRFSE